MTLRWNHEAGQWLGAFSARMMGSVSEEDESTMAAFSMPFTFYGDLLGTSAAYRLNPKAAYDKLNAFYNIVFERFGDLCPNDEPELHVQLFSDSVLLWGTLTSEVLEALQASYVELIQKTLLLRGAMVSGALAKDPRVEVKHLRKFLPTNDTLPRAVGLAVTCPHFPHGDVTP